MFNPKERDLKAIEDSQFNTVFQIDKTNTFEIHYKLNENEESIFNIHINRLLKNKRDYVEDGLAQKEFFEQHKNGNMIYDFCQKYQANQGKPLTEKTQQEMLKDIGKLKENYNFIEKTGIEAEKDWHFSHVVELSRQKPKEQVPELTVKATEAKKSTIRRRV